MDPWVLDYIKAYLSGSRKTLYAGYSKAYALAIVKHLHEEKGIWAGSGELMQIMNYSQHRAPLALLRQLEDEGYLRLDEARRRPVEILRYPYFVPRPEFVKERINELRHFGIHPPPEAGQA